MLPLSETEGRVTGLALMSLGYDQVELGSQLLLLYPRR